MLSGTVTHIQAHTERERTGNGTPGIHSLMYWAQKVEGGVTVGGNRTAQRVKSTAIIHALLHLAVILGREIMTPGSLEHIQ